MSKTASSESKPPKPIFPGWPTRIIVALAIGMVIVIRSLMRMQERPWPLNDVAFGNVLTLIFGFIAILTVWLWMCFASGWPRLVRLLALASPLVPIMIFMPFLGLLRLEEFDGNMRPSFVWRWSTMPDRLLPQVETKPAPKPIDLTTTTPDDFPGFLGPQRSGWVPGPALARDWNTQPPKQLWRRPIGAGCSAFAAVNGYAVTQEQRGDHEWITCYEIATGEPVWGQSIEARHQNALGGVGPRATPTIHGGRVYALGATGMLHCLDGATGKVLWDENLREHCGNLSQQEFEALASWGCAGSPLIVDGLVVVPGGGPADEAKNLIAFHAETGKVAWKSTCPSKAGGTEQIAYASPALAVLAGVRQILIVNEATASGHDVATGECLWSFEWPGRSTGDASASQPAPIGDDQVLLTKGYSGGAELLQLKPGQGKQLVPESQWKNWRALQTKFTNVVVYQDHAYALSEGMLECASLNDGTSRWKKRAGRYGHGQILGVGDLLLVLAEDGRLTLVELSPNDFTELGSFQALDGKCWNNLCLYGRKLLIRNSQEAACYELP